MGKKALVIIGLAAIIAASGGVMLSNHQGFVRGEDADPVSDSAYADEVYEPQDSDVEDSDTDSDDHLDTEDYSSDDGEEAPADPEQDVQDVTPTEEQDVQDTSASDPTDADEPEDTAQVSAGALTCTYTVQKIIDHATGEELSARVVLGSYADSCYMKLQDNGHFELYLNPSSGEVQSGTYKMYDHFISVLYDSGIGVEYSFIASVNGNIETIIVNSGDYDIYFG